MYEKIKEKLGFYPSEEQIKIIEAYKEGKSLNIQAFAGCSKTSTIMASIINDPSKKVLLLTFSKHLQVASQKSIAKYKLPNVVAKTINALAFQYVTTNYNISLMKVLHHSALAQYTDKTWDTLQAFNEFCLSSEEFKDDIMKKIFDDIWESNQATHAMIVKRFVTDLANNKAELPYDVIVVDEVQDIVPAMAQCIKYFKNQKIVTGDKHQTIFEFLLKGYSFYDEDIVFDETLYLTKSFRVATHLCPMVNSFMSIYFNETKEFKGVERNEEEPTKTLAVLTRTNADMLAFASILMNKNIKFKFQKEYKQIFKPLVEFEYIVNNIHLVDNCRNRKQIEKILKTKIDSSLVKELLQYNYYKWKYETFTSYIEKEGLSLYKVALTIMKSLKSGVTLYSIYKKLPNYVNPKANITIATVHTFKGSEADKVILFRLPSIQKLIADLEQLLKKNKLIRKNVYIQNIHEFKQYIALTEAKPIISELNLIYVAMTRAKNKIQFIDTDYDLYFNELK